MQQFERPDADADLAGADLTAFAAEHLPFINPHFAPIAAPALIVAGDKDRVALIQRVTTAYLRTALGADPSSAAAAGAVRGAGSAGRLESRQARPPAAAKHGLRALSSPTEGP